MAYVLGIDAAWTLTNPSGIALVSTETNPPKLIWAAPSFEDFVLRTKPEEWCGKHDFRASLGNVLSAAKGLGARSIDVIAVDMPLAHEPVRGRRHCDHLISKDFGGRGCATHTPTLMRPGEVSDRFLHEAKHAGFALVTAAHDTPKHALIEVYPHVALIELLGVDYRVPYKLSRRRRYWREASPTERLAKLSREWEGILRGLSGRIEMNLTVDCTGRTMQFWKAWEDVIDAIICCWVGTEWLAGRARPYGNEVAAIWVPQEVDIKHGKGLA